MSVELHHLRRVVAPFCGRSLAYKPLINHEELLPLTKAAHLVLSGSVVRSMKVSEAAVLHSHLQTLSDVWRARALVVARTHQLTIAVKVIMKDGEVGSWWGCTRENSALRAVITNNLVFSLAYYGAALADEQYEECALVLPFIKGFRKGHMTLGFRHTELLVITRD